MSYVAPRVLVPASTLVLLAERHEALCTAYRAGAAPSAELPSIYRLARDVVHRRASLELYRTRG